jgi:hypothetical protein
MSKPGGATIQAALASADAGLRARATAILAVCGEKVSALEALPPGLTMTPETIEQAYGLASDIVDVCGVMPMPEMFGAAYNLCEILDYFRTGPFSRSAFDVHVRAMRLILSHGANPAVNDLVSRLDAVKARVLNGRVEG